MSHPTPTPSVTEDVFKQFQLIDKALAHATACLALGLTGEMLEQLVRAQELSHSLNFRLESERLQPAPTTTANTQQEQAVLL
jgi:hypothetical protein